MCATAGGVARSNYFFATLNGICYQIRIRPHFGMVSSNRPTIKPPKTPSTPNQPQYELLHQSSGSNLYRFRSVSAVFELPDELILSILSHVSPDPHLTGHYARFCIPYRPGIDDYHRQRVNFLRPLSMTCRAMRLRLLPWVWERLEVPPRLGWGLEENCVQKFNAIANLLRADTFLGASVKYSCVLLYPPVRADSCLLIKVHDGAPSVERVLLSSIHQMPEVPPKSSHVRDMGGWHHDNLAREGA